MGTSTRLKGDSMKVGDLIRDKLSKGIGIIVGMEMMFDQGTTCESLDKRSPYYRCLIGDDYIWLFERHLEVIS